MARVFSSDREETQTIPSRILFAIILPYALGFVVCGFAFLYPQSLFLPPILAGCAMILVGGILGWVFQKKLTASVLAMLIFSVIAGVPALMGTIQQLT